MTDSPPNADPNTGAGIAPGRAPSTPRWVKLLGILGLIAVLLVVLVMLVGGGEHGPGRHIPSPATSSGQTPPVSAHASMTAVGGPAAAHAAARTVEITTLDAMAFEPSNVEVSAGETVAFVVTNAGQAVHEFTLGDAAMQQEHADAMAHMPHGMAHDIPNSITLQPGETKQLTWRFGGAGTLEYACHEPGHYEAGMRGQIPVR